MKFYLGQSNIYSAQFYGHASGVEQKKPIVVATRHKILTSLPFIEKSFLIIEF